MEAKFKMAAETVLTLNESQILSLYDGTKFDMCSMGNMCHVKKYLKFIKKGIPTMCASGGPGSARIARSGIGVNDIISRRRVSTSFFRLSDS